MQTLDGRIYGRIEKLTLSPNPRRGPLQRCLCKGQAPSQVTRWIAHVPYPTILVGVPRNDAFARAKLLVR
jgi:hypothetical protein